AFHGLGNAVDRHETVDHAAIALILAIAVVATTTVVTVAATVVAVAAAVIAVAVLLLLLCVHHCLLECEAGFTRRIRQRLDASVEQITAAIEHDGLDLGFFRALGDERAHGLGGSGGGAVLRRSFDFLLGRRSSSKRFAGSVV